MTITLIFILYGLSYFTYVWRTETLVTPNASLYFNISNCRIDIFNSTDHPNSVEIDYFMSYNVLAYINYYYKQ